MSATMNDVVTKMSKAEKRKFKREQGRQAAVQWAESRPLKEIDEVMTVLHCFPHPSVQYTDDAKALVATVREECKDYVTGFYDAVFNVFLVRMKVLDRIHRAQGLIDGMRWAKELSSAEELRRVCDLVDESDQESFDCMAGCGTEAHLLASKALGVALKKSGYRKYVVDWGVCWKFWQPIIDASGTTSPPKNDEEIEDKIRRFANRSYTCSFLVGAYAVAKNITRDIDVQC